MDMEQLAAWETEIKKIINDWRLTSSLDIISTRLIAILKNCFAYPNDSFLLEQIIIFNLASICIEPTDHSKYVYLSVLDKVQRLNPLIDISTHSSLYQNIEVMLGTLVKECSRIEISSLNLLLANISTDFVLNCKTQHAQLLETLKKKENERPPSQCIPHIDKNLLINRFFPLEDFVSDNHVEDVSEFNILLINIKACKVTKLDDIQHLASKPSLMCLKSLFTYLECMLYRQTANTHNYNLCLNSLMKLHTSQIHLVHLEANLLKGFDLFKNKCYQLSLAIYYQALKISPGSIRALVGASKCLKMTENLKSAINILEIAAKTSENSDVDSCNMYISKILTYIFPHTENIEECSKVRILEEIACISILSQDFDKAVKTLMSCLNMFNDKDATVLHKWRLGACFSLLMTGHPDEAITIANFINSRVSLKRKQETEPIELLTCFFLARGLADTNQNTRSLNYFDKALKCLMPIVREGQNKRSSSMKDGFNQESSTNDSMASCLKLRTYSEVRARIYLEKSKIHKRSGDITSWKQCLQAAVSYSNADYILQMYRNHLQECEDEKYYKKASDLINRKKVRDKDCEDTSDIDKSRLDIINLCIHIITNQDF